ncbi:hypothetical protein V3470_11865 [Flavobacterium oreochromis]|uniref:T9SS C-terminal target domain-containing protein n=1 Tax=Flavobacterium oreochromis TaxID=2906078 RepID=A0ABW8PBF1_9FLAO|nr:hypothetical protein [Flavobacterium oreochromis]OWP76805.1 hypothetical protein BWG23_06990 [Flavobacterium oreochromis]
MKKKLLGILLLVFASGQAQNAQGIYGDFNWFNNWTNFKPKTQDYAAPSRILNGEISENTTLKKGTYLIMGSVYVANGATLTLEPGVVMRGDFDSNGTLIVTKGSKIKAEGTETDPIVFTSSKGTSDRKPGDWGGIIIYGDAPVNRYGGIVSSIYDPNPKYNLFGGNNENGDSGVLKYVRIEFAGKKLNEKTMLNGLTLGAVGKKTKIEYVQISMTKDDGLEIVGGVFDMNNIISFQNADDDFDFSMGAICTMSNSVAIRNPYISDNTRSRVMEIDTYDKLENYDPTRKKTVVKLNNVTMVSNEDNAMGLVKEAISVRTDSFVEINKCVVSGFASVIAADDKYLEKENYKQIKIANTIINNCTEVITNENLVKAEEETDWFMSKDKANSITKITNVNMFKSNDVRKKPDFRLR